MDKLILIIGLSSKQHYKIEDFLVSLLLYEVVYYAFLNNFHTLDLQMLG